MLRKIKSLLWNNSTSPKPPPPSMAAQRTLAPSWIIPGKLAVGRLPIVGESWALKQAHIKVILSLCAESEGELPDDVRQNFKCVRFILPDSFYVVGMTPEDLATVVDLIHAHIENQEPVYVHCVAGVERSPTVCIAYLCLYHHLELWEAASIVKRSHLNAFPSEAQLQVVRQLLRLLQED